MTRTEWAALRDEFALALLPSEYARVGQMQKLPEGWRLGLALDIYGMAEAMMEAREATLNGRYADSGEPYSAAPNEGGSR